MVVHPEFGGSIPWQRTSDQGQFEAEVEAAIAWLRELIAKQEAGLAGDRLAQDEGAGCAGVR